MLITKEDSCSATETKCLSGDGCEKNAVESTTFPGKFRFCGGHQKDLERWRDEMADRDKKKGPRDKSNILHRYCETPGCSNRPIYSSDYCAACSGGDV